MNLYKNVKKSMFNFIWNKTDRIKRNTIIGKISDGGVGIVDFELKLRAIKASWICRICKETSNLYNVVNSYCSRYGVNIEYLVKLSERNNVNFEIISCLPSFYREILCCFNNCKKSLNTVNLSNAEFIQQPLWNNEMFKYNGKTIFFKRWSQSNILYVKDLFDEHGNFRSLQQLSCILNDKTNWLCEYKVMKSVLKRYYMKFDMSYCYYTKISSKRTFLFHTGYKSMVDKRCNFFMVTCYKENLKNLVIRVCLIENFLSRKNIGEISIATKYKIFMTKGFVNSTTNSLITYYVVTYL